MLFEHTSGKSKNTHAKHVPFVPELVGQIVFKMEPAYVSKLAPAHTPMAESRAGNL
jgi:hypothetical protein